MTEHDWFNREWPSSMLRLVAEQAASRSRPAHLTDRKFRLFACASCRSISGLLVHPATRNLVDIAERFAEGKVTRLELRGARREAVRGQRDDPAGTSQGGAWLHASDAAVFLGEEPLHDVAELLVNKVLAASLCDPNQPSRGDDYHAGLIRCIFGNPFRPVAFDPSWRTSTATELARQMYESRTFDRMPILADALQDAGCDEPSVIVHCQSDGPHVRGCWVVDLVLGKG